MNLLIILAVLFIGLLILVPLLERFGGSLDREQVRKLSRWIFPLLALLLLIRIFDYYFF